MRKLLVVMLVVGAVGMGAGCGVVRKVQSSNTSDKLMMLDSGMDKRQVLEIMGIPEKRELYGDDEYLIYRTDHWATKESDKFTPIYLKNGKVVGWGRNYYDYSTRSKIEADIIIKK